MRTFIKVPGLTQEISAADDCSACHDPQCTQVSCSHCSVPLCFPAEAPEEDMSADVCPVCGP